MFQFEDVRQENSPLPGGESAFCYIQAFTWLGEAHPHWGGQSAFFFFFLKSLPSTVSPGFSPVLASSSFIFTYLFI